MRREHWPAYYILIGRTPMAVDMWTWAEAAEDRMRTIKEKEIDSWRVGRTVIDADLDIDVSTVFLGLDHNWGRGDPILFETMVFGPDEFADGRPSLESLYGVQERYATWKQAEEGHQRVVEKVTQLIAEAKATASQIVQKHEC